MKRKHPLLRRIPGTRQWIIKIERLEAERGRLQARIRKLERRLDQALTAVPPRREESVSARREQYKIVWTNLSATEGSARFHIGGFTQEELFESTGLETKNILLETVGIDQRDTVVEIGCGVGRVGRQLADKCRKWIGCDVSPNMLRFATERLKGFDNVEFYEINGYDLQPLQSESADVVYCTIVFMHLEEWDRYGFVLEAYRILRPGGRIFIDNVNLCSDAGWEVFERHREFSPDARPAHISKSSTPSELTTYLARAGFVSIRVLEEGAWVRVWGVK